MANDDPTNQRMDFGFTGARASGITNFRRPTEAKFYDFCVDERKATDAIAALSKAHPSLKQRFVEIAQREVRRKYHRVQDILYVMLQEVERDRAAGRLK
jgi:hypothetical protein